jgi:predicted acetyltransferase
MADLSGMPGIGDTNGGPSHRRKDMTHHGETESPHIEVIRAAPEQAPILGNLLELYAHDFSEFRNLEIGEDGRFGYRSLPLYWSEPNRHPFFIRMDGKLAGLVFVKRGSEVSGDDAVWDMAEFFIVRGCRRCGIGTRAAHEVWRRFPGRWEVRVMQANVPAQHFWAEAISTYAGEVIHPVRIDNGGECWTVYSFESKP